MKFKASDFFLAMAVFILAFSVLAFGIKPASFLPDGTEIIEKRTWSSKTFSDGEGHYYTEFGLGRIHFWDGFMYQDLDKYISPKIVKNDIVLQEKPSSLQCEFMQFPVGNYKLHRGISAELKENMIYFKDAENELIFQMTTPHSFDAKMSVYENLYRTKQEGRNLDIWMDVSCDWLNKAPYPVIVDASVDTNHNVLSTDAWLRKPSSGIADTCALAQISSTSSTKATDYNISVGLQTNVNTKYHLRRGFIEFDTTTLTGSTLNSAKVFYKVISQVQQEYVADINLLGSSTGASCWGASIDLNDWEECINNEGSLFRTTSDVLVDCTGTDPNEASNDNCPGRLAMSVSTAGINTTGNTQYKIMHSDENACTALGASQTRIIPIEALEDPDTNHFILYVSYTQAVPEFTFLTAFIAAIITFSVVVVVGYRRKEN